MAKRTATETVTKTKRARRMVKRPRGLTALSPKLHQFSRTCSVYSQDTGVYLRTDGAGGLYFSDGTNLARSLAFDFSLQQVRIYLGGVVRWTLPVPNYTEFTALFDQYRIDGVDVSLSPGFNANNLADSGYVNTGTGAYTGAAFWEAYGIPCIGAATDLDDVGNTVITDLQQYDTFRYVKLGQAGAPILVRKFRPRPAIQYYNTAISAAYGTGDNGPFIDCSSASCPHYGLKMALDAGNANRGPILTNIAQMNIIVKLRVSMRNVR